ncbi:MAG: DedA family protein [Pyrinomonadaceae bacterium]|nr:DedA family protein [Pyrinomonadaceae bacterium]
MNFEQIFNQLIQQYGVYAVFVLCMIEGDITLLLSGVLAHNDSFGSYSYLKVVFFGTLGAVAGDFCGYLIGRVFQRSVEKYGFYKMAEPRIKSLNDKFGGFSIFISKYIYGIRAAWCIFFGVAKTPVWKFLLYDAASCFLWVLSLSGLGYFFSGAVTNLIGDFHKIGIAVLIIIAVGILAFYLIERFWLSRKVEEAGNDGSILKLEKVAQTKLHDLSEGIQERLHLTSNGSSNGHNQNERQQQSPPPPLNKPQNVEGD